MRLAYREAGTQWEIRKDQQPYMQDQRSGAQHSWPPQESGCWMELALTPQLHREGVGKIGDGDPRAAAPGHLCAYCWAGLTSPHANCSAIRIKPGLSAL